MTSQETQDGVVGLSDLMCEGADAASSDHPVVARARRSRRRRALLIATAVVTTVLAAGGGYVWWALTAPLSAPAGDWTVPPVAVQPAARIALPTEGAAAISVAGGDAYLGDAASGVWLSSGTDEARSIASITKLVTALVILDAKPLTGIDDPGPTVTFDKADHDLYDAYYVRGATIAAMPTGSTMSLRDALATMLIPSASNYAEAVSTWAFGSQSSFLRATGDWLAGHGLAGTTIVEPTGLSPRNTSTPGDLLAIGKLAAANPVIAQIAATPSLTLPGPGVMHNTNGLLGVDGITGLKTGNLGPGTFALLYTAEADAGEAGVLSVTGVVLGGSSRESVDAGVRATLASIRDGFRTVPLVEAGQEVGEYTTAWGSQVRVVISRSARIFAWSDTPIVASVETITPAKFADGEVVGRITWAAGPHTTTADVEIDGTVEPPTDWWRLTHPEELG